MSGSHPDNSELKVKSEVKIRCKGVGGGESFLCGVKVYSSLKDSQKVNMGTWGYGGKNGEESEG